MRNEEKRIESDSKRYLQRICSVSSVDTSLANISIANNRLFEGPCKLLVVTWIYLLDLEATQGRLAADGSDW